MLSYFFAILGPAPLSGANSRSSFSLNSPFISLIINGKDTTFYSIHQIPVWFYMKSIESGITHLPTYPLRTLSFFKNKNRKVNREKTYNYLNAII